ncbi:hypothetical protein [Tenacibaculum soleae]|uniref:hypothetical protein n=1 Tax=Tenacibaculum soleae TaxID=447689 RepID=UPI0026E34278|nr:hypothetical protein [Tenacibaculum soleae]MDO6813825.1 hypothetical protein [Tenacibaculum soleae]
MGKFISHGDVAFGIGSKAMFSFGSDTKAKHTVVNPNTKNTKAFVPWGADNKYPDNFLQALRLNGSGSAGLRFLKSTHYGQGFHLYKNEGDANGKLKKKIITLKEAGKDIQTFFKRNRLERFWNEHIADLETFYVSQPEFILSKDYSKIYSTRRLQASKCRYQPINPKTGLIENIFYCHNWEANTDVTSDFVEKIPVIDSYWSADQVKEYCKKKKIHKFVMPTFYPLMNETYYPEADWHAVYHNGWMDVANSIPEFKKALFTNQINVKYIVHISEEYFKRTYGADWLEYTPEKRKEIRDQLTNAIDSHLSGNKNAGKSIQSVTYLDQNQNWVKGIEVEAVDNKLKDGAYLPEASAANSEIMFALGVDPSLLGAGIPGGKMNTGSGSDKREAFSILTSLFKSKREISLYPWQFIRDYNGWDEELEGGFGNIELTTLDVNPTGTQNIL